ncbi:type II 3-dehydroquinate dehydratase [Enterobacteriaceae endosymbiont of Plateumaris pusilla]|uniref:type II 3-dehydroquinate dehydratase n=1 Tax=Enterobacteriaceae endosymbiont of Plateumaris pusilla TaxID=2675795 RepID=UPI001448D092|nr:type II 3-dehydroquinate dehydratase [Enterobacteriaceae endosymbiont of Plateumaris pusilla]QJC29322.1 type II 3-dehydroquinate dehydratase [Enterobacteriaceae endosymbiont of Plateumaris pusilla]
MKKYKNNILILNGPNLNLLGKREPKKYGYLSLNTIINKLIIKANNNNFKLSHFQSNSECLLIDYLINFTQNIDYIIFNPAAFTHTSIALRDTLLSINIPFIEIHITNIFARESFRKKSYFSDISNGIISGLGIDGYFLALDLIIRRLS